MADDCVRFGASRRVFSVDLTSTSERQVAARAQFPSARFAGTERFTAWQVGRMRTPPGTRSAVCGVSGGDLSSNHPMRSPPTLGIAKIQR